MERGREGGKEGRRRQGERRKRGEDESKLDAEREVRRRHALVGVPESAESVWDSHETANPGASVCLPLQCLLYSMGGPVKRVGVRACEAEAETEAEKKRGSKLRTKGERERERDDKVADRKLDRVGRGRQKVVLSRREQVMQAGRPVAASAAVIQPVSNESGGKKRRAHGKRA